MYKIKKMLSDVFGDTPEYLDAIERLGFLRKDNCFVIYDEGEPVSVIFTEKYPLNLDSNLVWADYLYYAATDIRYRNRGLMHRLVSESLDILKTRGSSCAVLIPAERSLFDLYSSMGFQQAFYIKKQEFLPENGRKNVYIPSAEEAKKSYSKYYDFYGKRKNTLYKTEELFGMSIDENLLEPDSCTVLSDGDSFAFVKIGEIIEIREFYGSDPSGFASAVADKYQKKTVMSLVTDEMDYPLGMISLYDDKKNLPPLFADNLLN